MTQSMLLPWFPIILAVGVGGRLLGRQRGLGLGILCSLFWVALVQAAQGLAVWQSGWTAFTLLVGSFAMIMMGAWSGEAVADGREPTPAFGEAKSYTSTWASAATPSAVDDDGLLQTPGGAIEQFHDWLEQHRERSDPWPDFGEFVRGVLFRCCRATHVKPYALVAERQELELLRGGDPLRELERLPARKGIVGHVLTTGRSYLAGVTDGDLVGVLAQETESPVPWCFAVRCGTRRMGVVSVGHLNVDPVRHRVLLRGIEHLIALFWGYLAEVSRSRLAGDDDPVSRLLNREAFFRTAERALREAGGRGEPVAVAIISIEGLRRLNDAGQWDMADELLREVGAVLRRKVRLDDQIGRFDGARFVWLLRRVDSELARLIVNQIMDRLEQVLADPRWSNAEFPVGVQCGLSGAGLQHSSVRGLVAKALVQAQRARTQRVRMVTDLDETNNVKPRIPVTAGAAK